MLDKYYADKIHSLSILLDDMIEEQTDSEQIARVQNMILTTKREFVQKYHNRAISFVESRGRYQTRVGSPRKTVERTNYDELIDYLYQFYQMDIIEIATLEQAVDRYVEDLLRSGRSKETAYRRKACFLRMSTPNFRKKKVLEITKWDIQDDIMAVLTKEEKKIPVRAVKDYLQVLNKIFDEYMADGYLKRQPCKMIKATDYGNYCKQNTKTDEEKMFSPNEIKKLWDYELKHFDNPHSQAILVSILTGLRAGEIPPLRWDDISDGYIHIYRQQRKISVDIDKETFVEVDGTKNEKNISKGGRYIPIVPDLQFVLTKIQEYQTKNNIKTNYLFVYPDGRTIKKDNYEQYLHRHCIALGLTVTKNHGIRKSFNSLILIPSGLNLLERSMILGHSPETNQRYYSLTGKHLLEGVGEKISQAELLSQINDSINTNG